MLGAGDHQVTHEYNPFSDEIMRGDRAIPESKRRYTAPGYAKLKSDDWSADDLGDAMMSDRLRWAGDDDDQQ